MANLTDIRSSWSTGASEGGVTVYATKEDLPTSGLTSGDQAYVTGNSRFYISNGSGWYNVALVNATPTLTIDPTGSIALALDGSPTTITLIGTDSDNAIDGLTYSVESDGSFAGLATLSQDSSVFTITPLSEDSATTAAAVLTFKASDGISFGTQDKTLTLEFKVANSNHSTLLLKADNASADNQVDASTNNHTLTENGNVTSTAFTPYHPGLYSWYWQGDGGDYFTIQSPTSALSFGTGDFCIEMWIYLFNSTDTMILADMRPDSTNGAYMGAFGIGSGNVNVGHNGSTVLNTSGAPLEFGWNHIALNRVSGTMSIFVNGTREATTSTEYNFLVGKYRLFVNAFPGGGISDGSGGYLKDYRVVKGDGVYGSGTSLTVPTESLTAITGTAILLFQNPYRLDVVGTETISYVGGAMGSFGPFDHGRYSKADYGGSVYFDGTDDFIEGPAVDLMGSGAFTVECWVYVLSNGSTYTDAFLAQYQTNNKFILGVKSNVVRVWMGGSEVRVGTTNINNNGWHHIALVRNASNSCQLYVDGVADGAAFSNSTNFSTSLENFEIGSWDNGSGSDLHGYISDLRVVKGTAVYTSAFTPPTAPRTAITGTSLLTCTNKNNIWDVSSGTLLSKSGDVTASNTQRKFTNESAIYFDGTGDYIALGSHINNEASFRTGDFTLEFWIWFANQSANMTIFDARPNNVNGAYITLTNVSGSGFSLYVNTASRIAQSSPVTSQEWHHVAISRVSGTTTMYVDGTSVGTWSDSTDYVTGGGRPLIGRNAYADLSYFNGYIQDLRITKGLGRYTTNFTPTTAEFSG